MSAAGTGHELIQLVTLLGAAVALVPLFRWAKLGSVLGYLFAGLVIGPFGLKLFSDSQAILHIAELGVVMFLFVIGLEMRPSHLWKMRGDIFGLGTFQIALGSAAMFLAGWIAGFEPMVALICALGFILTSTAVVMQILGERGNVSKARGQKIVSILLFEDLLIIPLLALVAFLSPVKAGAEGASYLVSVGVAALSFAGLIVAGLYLLNPLFHYLAKTRSREVLTAAALLVVLGSALLMQVAGLSMAMGAFAAGVLLSESSFRHQIEADIEPFRGILLGLFFMGVGMSLNISIVVDNLVFIVVAVLVLMFLKATAIYMVARKMGTSHCDALDRSVLMAQGGEFAFVLFVAATQGNLISLEQAALMTALVILSMALTPLFIALLRRCPPNLIGESEDLERPQQQRSSVLLIGFGRFGQVVSQLLLARNFDITIIDSDPKRIRNAARFGFKIYYGDGSRIDVLRASGAETAQTILVCIDSKDIANKITEIVKETFPHSKILVRAYDRVHARELFQAGVDFQIRETFESAFKFGEESLKILGLAEFEVAAVAQEIRKRDAERFQIELVEGSDAGKRFLQSNQPTPAPLIEPQQTAIPLNPEAASLVSDGGTK